MDTTKTDEQQAICAHITTATRYLESAAESQRLGVPHEDALRMARAHASKVDAIVPGWGAGWHRIEAHMLGRRLEGDGL